jgi:glycosyltransferase involved in cell wall biosynthesis
VSAVRRVLFVTHNFPRATDDAAGGFLLDLARAVREAGVPVDVIAPHAPGLADQEFIDGIPVARVRYADEEHETLAYTGTMAEQVRGSLRGKRTLIGLMSAMRRAVGDRLLCGDISLVHAHWWFPAALAVRGIAHRHRVPLVVTAHGSDARMATGLMAHLASHALRDAAAVTTVSQWLAARLRPLTPAPIAVAPMPAAVTSFVPRADDRARVPTLLFVGRLNAQKNLRVILEALPQLAADVVLDVVGDGPDEGELRARALMPSSAARASAGAGASRGIRCRHWCDTRGRPSCRRATRALAWWPPNRCCARHPWLQPAVADWSTS